MSSGIRTNGFQKPLSRDQVTSWVLQPFMMSGFIAFVAKLLDRDKCIAILVPTGILILIILWCWFLCERKDPSRERSKSGMSLLSIPPKMTRYCTICCKTSPGLDHHCTWLNTCIADNNYEAFYYLVVAATLETILQAVIGILMATIWFDEIKAQLTPSWHTPMIALLWTHNAIILSLANSYFLLAGFHTYLLIIRSGTYDFILENGSDGICARMLKCRCFTKSKGTRRSVARGEKRRSMSKTTPIAPSSKVVAAPARAVRGDGPTTQDLAVSAAKQREIEQWKAEWLKKYGSDDSDESTATTAEPTMKAGTNIDASLPQGVSAATPVAAVSTKRRSTNPDVDQQTHDQVQIEMSAGVNESEGIIEDIESAVGERDDQVKSMRPPVVPSPPSPGSAAARGARTDL